MHRRADTPRERLRRFVGLCHERLADLLADYVGKLGVGKEGRYP